MASSESKGVFEGCVYTCTCMCACMVAVGFPPSAAGRKQAPSLRELRYPIRYPFLENHPLRPWQWSLRELAVRGTCVPDPKGHLLQWSQFPLSCEQVRVERHRGAARVTCGGQGKTGTQPVQVLRQPGSQSGSDCKHKGVLW